MAVVASSAVRIGRWMRMGWVTIASIQVSRSAGALVAMRHLEQAGLIQISTGAVCRGSTVSVGRRCETAAVTDEVFGAGRAFLDREGRLVERRLAAALFDDADPVGAVDAVRAFRNSDGGFGHGLEPDKRCPDSLPIDVERAFDVLLSVGAGDGDSEVVRQACDWLDSVARADGAVSLAFPVIEKYPRAEHWSDWTYSPALNPTAGLAGRLHRMGVTHPWLARATEWTWQRLESGLDEDDAHTFAEVLEFLAYVPDQARADTVSTQIVEWLSKLRWFRSDPADPTYGLTPLHFAPTPDSPWRSLFDEATIAGHLDRLARDQRKTAAGPSPGPPPEQPQPSSGAASKPSAPSKPSPPTTTSDEPAGAPSAGGRRVVDFGWVGALSCSHNSRLGGGSVGCQVWAVASAGCGRWW